MTESVVGLIVRAPVDQFVTFESVAEAKRWFQENLAYIQHDERCDSQEQPHCLDTCPFFAVNS